MDNRRFLVKSEGREQFNLAMQLAFTDKYGAHKATHFSESKENGLVFHYHDEPNLNTSKLVVPMDHVGATEIAWQWLLAQPKERYIDDLDHDGSNGKGFQICNHDWNRVRGTNCGMISILPCWMWYGK